MGRGISEAQWLAARELSEGQPPTRVRVAAVLGVDNSHVYSRSSAEGWKTIDHRNQEIRGLYREVQTIAAALSGRESPEGEVANVPPPNARAKEAAGPGGPPPPTGAPADPAAMRAMGPDAGEGATRDPAAEPASALAVPDWDRMDPVELLANASGFVARQVGRLAALGKMMDRWEVLAAERTKDNKKKSDEKLADVFKRIDRRIVELAVEGAQFLDQRRRRGRGTTRRRGVADAGSPGTDSDLAQPAR